jgi:hypothetical protein
MPEINSIDLRGKVADAGRVHFLRAEWQVPHSRFVILRYSVDNKEPEPRFGLRLDLDKVAILDDIGDPATDVAVKDRAKQIWDIVIMYRRERRQVYA